MMVRPLVRAQAALALASTLVGVASTSASADRWWGPDKAGDVRQVAFSPEPAPCGTVTESVASQDASTDIVGLSVRHERDSVELRAYVRNLTGWDDRWFSYSLQTDHRAYAISLMRDPAKYSGQPTLWDASEPPSEPDECGYFSTLMAGLPCPDLSMSRSSERDFVSVIVPRSCLARRGGAGQVRATSGRSTADSGPVGHRRHGRAGRDVTPGPTGAAGPAHPAT